MLAADFPAEELDLRPVESNVSARASKALQISNEDGKGYQQCVLKLVELLHYFT